MKPNQALSLKTLPPDLERLLPIFFLLKRVAVAELQHNVVG